MKDSFGSSSQSGLGGLLINTLTLLAFVATVCLGAAFAAVFVNPQLPINPFPPPTLPPTASLPTATSTPEIPVPPTATPSPVIPPTDTPVVITPTAPPQATPSAQPSATPAGPFFGLQPGSPVGIPNIANDQACKWTGVGGQIFDLQSNPVTPGMIVHLEGTFAGNPIFLDTLTGSATALGTAGYIFNLGTQPAASQGTIWIQVHDAFGAGLSDKVFLTTYASCEQNLLLVNWRQVR